MRLFARCFAEYWPEWPAWTQAVRDQVLRSVVTFMNGLTASAVTSPRDWPANVQLEQLRLQLDLLRHWARLQRRLRAAKEGGLMMDFSLNDEQQMIVKIDPGVRRQRALPAREGGRGERRLRADLHRELKGKAIDAGLYAANMPAEVGGAGLDTVTWVLYEKELGRTNYALHYRASAGLRTSCSPARASSGNATCCRPCAASGSNAWR